MFTEGSVLILDSLFNGDILIVIFGGSMLIIEFRDQLEQCAFCTGCILIKHKSVIGIVT